MKEIDSVEDWCVHYGGFGRPFGIPIEQHACEAGIRYWDVKVEVEGASTNLDRLPCFKRNGLPCTAQRFRTPEEVAQKNADAQASIKRYFDDIAEDKCPHCHQPLTSKRQIGRCVYGEPCGHRLYQGWLTPEAEEQAAQQGLWP